jgi:23S rRNA maturation-related 3'-5' exoribonuclease YhaM
MKFAGKKMTRKQKPKYQGHRLDKDGHVTKRVGLVSSNEVKAIQEAMMLCVNNSYEVWQGNKLIVHIDPRSDISNARRSKQS